MVQSSTPRTAGSAIVLITLKLKNRIRGFGKTFKKAQSRYPATSKLSFSRFFSYYLDNSLSVHGVTLHFHTGDLAISAFSVLKFVVFFRIFRSIHQLIYLVNIDVKPESWHRFCNIVLIIGIELCSG